MGGFQPAKAERQYGGRPGKIDAPLDAKLKSVKWGEFKLRKLFNHIEQGRRVKKSDHKPGDIPFVMSGVTNQGVVGYIANPVASFPSNSITVDIFGNTFYRNYAFGAGDDTGVYWSDKIQYSEKQMLFIAAAIGKTLKGKYDYGHKLRSSQSFDFKIPLPKTTIGEIDFAFMEDFVRELEAYLLATGLSDYSLSPAEEKTLKHLPQIHWKEFPIKDVFDVKNTHNILLSEIVENSGATPYLCASAENNSVSSYISYKEQLLERGKCVFIGGKTFVVSYQQMDFFSNDSHNLALYPKHIVPSRENLLYLVTCIFKSLKYKYSWGDSVSKTKILGDTITLPVSKKGLADLTTAVTLIRAVQKLVIKDVVDYADRRLADTIHVVAK